MKIEYFIWGVLAYTALIGAGFYRKRLEWLENLPWNEPLYALIQGQSIRAVPYPILGVDGTRHARKAVKTPLSGSPASIAVGVQDPIRQSFDKKWKTMAAHPVGFGFEVEPENKTAVFWGSKPASKTTPVIPEKKAPHEVETTKG